MRLYPNEALALKDRHPDWVRLKDAPTVPVLDTDEEAMIRHGYWLTALRGRF